jgi:hypothetical protein
MDEFTLIKQLESLKTVKTSADWASLTKAKIMKENFEKQSFSLFDILKQSKLVPAFASVMIFFSVVPFFFAQDALPGEALYKYKKLGEAIQYTFKQDKSVAQLEQVQSRLSELDKITKQSENQGYKLAAGIKETKEALNKATQELNNVPEAQKAELVAQIVTQITAIEKKTNAAIMDSDKEYQELYKFFVENEIKELDAKQENLNKEQIVLLNKVKDLFEQEKYSEAMEVIYEIQPNN